MNNKQGLSITLLVDQSPGEAYDAINNVRGWWSQKIQGRTDELGEFKYSAEPMHRCTIKVTELVPGKRVAWHVVDNYFSFVKDQGEWKDTDIIFDIARKGGKTEIRFTHVGLVRAFECYDVCSDAWSHYIRGSLRDLIAKAKGKPSTNEGIIKRHGLGEVQARSR